MELKLVGNVEEIGDQVAALAELFQPSGVQYQQDAARTVRTPISPAASPVVITPPDAGSAGSTVGDVADLDVDGQPWNAEIHSSNKSKKRDGRWTLRRGADKARVAVVYAEYTASQVQTVAVTSVAPPVTPPSATAPVFAAAPPALGVAPSPVTQPTLPPPLGTGLPPVSPPAPVGEDPVAACIRIATALMTSTTDPAAHQAISARVNEVMRQSGLGGMPELQANPQVAPTALIGLRSLAVQYGVQC